MAKATARKQASRAGEAAAPAMRFVRTEVRDIFALDIPFVGGPHDGTTRTCEIARVGGMYSTANVIYCASGYYLFHPPTNATDRMPHYEFVSFAAQEGR